MEFVVRACKIWSGKAAFVGRRELILQNPMRWCWKTFNPDQFFQEDSVPISWRMQYHITSETFSREMDPPWSQITVSMLLFPNSKLNQQTTFNFLLKVHWSPWSNTHCSISLQNQGWVAEKSAKLVLHTMWLPVSPFSQLNGESWIRG